MTNIYKEVDRALADAIVERAQRRVENEFGTKLDATPWEETLNSQAFTIQRAKYRAKTSGKNATIIIGEYSRGIHPPTAGLQPNEHFLFCLGTTAATIADKRTTEWDMLHDTIEVLSKMKNHGSITDFDFGKVIYSYGEGQQIESDTAIAIFITSPAPTHNRTLEKTR